ncbi:hypothetical protein ACFY05_22715 [Microtetraspora fusca]|uniref:Uncharacterized protein n=1 Tax=Microtetraspora fusca TaxID=1997 RepID=A0ABW6V8L3_MICFU
MSSGDVTDPAKGHPASRERRRAGARFRSWDRRVPVGEYVETVWWRER